MYGRGNSNYGTQFGQGLQRPMPPFQQPPGGRPPQFQPGQPFPPPHGLPPRFSGYPQAPPVPMNMPQRVPPGSTLNTSQSFLQPPPTVLGGAPGQHPYSAGPQQFTPGTQNLRPGAPSLPRALFGPPAVPPPPPLQQAVGYGPPGSHSTFGNQQAVHSMRHPPPPPPPQSAAAIFPPAQFKPATQQPIAESNVPTQLPPLPASSPPPAPPLPLSSPSSATLSAMPTPSTGSSPVKSENRHGDIKTDSHDGVGTLTVDEGSFSEQTNMDLPHPPKPANEKVVRNIEVLCQFIAKNGPQFEEMARQNESGNPEFSFLVGGDPGSEASCAREYYLWMKKKCVLLSDMEKDQGQGSVSQKHVDAELPPEARSFENARKAHSPDSDVDMEDDITQSDKEPGVYHLSEDSKPESVPGGELLEMQKHTLQYSREGIEAVNMSPTFKPQEVDEPKAENPAGQPSSIDSPFRLIQNYASDDTSEDEGEPPCKEDEDKALVVMPPPKHESSTSHDVEHSSIDFKSGKHEAEDKYDRSEPLTPNIASQERYASESSGPDAASAYKDIEREVNTNTSTALKVDEFGRLIKEGVSESESDGCQRMRRRGRRDRSRSRSRSPSDRRRRRSPRRSPRRRKDRRSQSRSWSPRRRRSRSISPYWSGGDLGGEKLHRGKVQTHECFDFLKGRCYRGASCRYLHHDVDKSENSGRYQSKQQQLDMGRSLNSDCHGKSVSSSIPQEHDDNKDEKVGRTNPMDDNLRSREPHNNARKFENYREGVAQVLEASDVPIRKMVSSSESEYFAIQTEEKVSHIPTEINASNPKPSGQISSLPLPNPVSLSVNAPLDSKAQVNYNLPIPSVSLPPQSVPVQSVPSYQAPLSVQQFDYSGPPNSTWSIHPPLQPRPPCVIDPSVPGLLFQQGRFPLRHNFPDQASMRAHLVGMPSHSQAGSFQYQTYHNHLNTVSGQLTEGPNPTRDDRVSQFSSQGQGVLGPFVPALASLPVPFTGDSTGKDLQSLPVSNLLPGESSKHKLSQQRLPPYVSPLTAAEGVSSYHGGSISMPRYVSDDQDGDHPSHFPDVGGSRISAHYNPFASTFDQPLSSRFSSTADKDATSGVKFGSSFSLSHGPSEVPASAAHVSRQIISSPNSSRAWGPTLARSGGDQYDPLFDSIEPSSKRAQKQDHAADNSDIMLRISNHQTLLAVTENKQKDVGPVATTTSLENDEYGETADAEVGAVENGSPIDPDEDDVAAEGEIEIDQDKSEGKSKKSKDSRSMKLFKVAIANFVKDVLKPQWRQGNMSKEVFKTIVKKTVDKVSGAMKSHRLPKSQAKIDHYIESSRRKLTLLVEGYVSKYKS